MADYINPFAGMPNPSAFDIQPNRVPSLMSYKMAADNQLAMNPSIDLARKGQENDLASQVFRNKEYQSDWATAGRRGTAESQEAAGREAKGSVDYKIEAQRIANLLNEEAVKTAQDNHARFLQANNQGAYGKFAEFGKQLSNMDPAARPMAFNNIASAIKAQYPNAQLPDYLQKYIPGQTDSHLMTAYLSQLYSAQNQQARDLQTQKDTAQNARNAATNQANIKATQIREAGQNARNQTTLDAGNVPRIIANLRKTLSDKAATPDMKQQAHSMLYSYVAQEADQMAQKDPVIQAMAIDAATNPQAADAIDQRRAQLRIERLRAEGLLPRMSEWKQRYPGKSEAEIREGLKKLYGKDVY